MSGHANEELGVLASITAAIEAARTEITDIKIETTESVCRGSVCLAIPLNDIERLEDTRIATERGRVVDESLELEIEIEIEATGTDPPNDSQSTAVQQDMGVSDPDTDRAAGEGKNRQRAQSSDDGSREAPTGESDPQSDQTTAQPSEPTATTTDGEPAPDSVTGDRRAETELAEGGERGGRTETEQDRAPYRDPERLVAVYDEDATFKEMKDELGVDVTAQTVRKYMITYGIHDPEPRPDRMLESIRASEFDLMNSEEDGRPDRSAEPDESDPSDT